MADSPAFESPVSTPFVSYAGVPMEPGQPDAPLSLCDISPTTKIIVRAGPETNASRRMSVPFGTSRTEAGVLIVGQRPDEWVLLGRRTAIGGLVESLDRAGHVSVIDSTHGRAMFRLTGADAASLLEKLCSLDWNDHMTPDGAAVSGSVAKVTCDLVRNDLEHTPSYLISCDRSYGQYLFEVILDAGQEFGISPLGESID
ncbi:MAG: hypothetical protein OXS29_14695 [bacterium]|nr:hypothetical protein [bacterium]MDE0290367.1 hypothetical protein [bacterium]MDE0438541.1 hypothetical protein [bacterium]